MWVLFWEQRNWMSLEKKIGATQLDTTPKRPTALWRTRVWVLVESDGLLFFPFFSLVTFYVFFFCFFSVFAVLALSLLVCFFLCFVFCSTDCFFVSSLWLVKSSSVMICLFFVLFSQRVVAKFVWFLCQRVRL